jgi:hypothetical protein
MKLLWCVLLRLTSHLRLCKGIFFKFLANPPKLQIKLEIETNTIEVIRKRKIKIKT